MERHEAMPVGIIVQKRRINHPWQEWTWEPVGVLPWAEEGVRWRLLTEEPDRIRYHAATMTVHLYRSDTEAYVANLDTGAPAIYVGISEGDPAAGEWEFEPSFVSLSPYEAQDRTDSAEELIERLEVPPAMLEWLEAFVAKHHEEEAFVKRRRDRIDVEQVEDGKGDPRIRQTSDVYRAPTGRGRR
jgi:hypothetical protein